jgi:single-stranded DNA-binding protein
MIESLVSGRIHQAAKEKTDRTGKPFATVRLKVPHGESSLLIGVICFEPTAVQTLLALDVGDAVTVAGSLTCRVWTDSESRAKPSADLIAHVVLSPYHASRKLRALAGQIHDGATG